ncbi:MAG: YhcH/YjgK/YiaL family protein [Candidatus Scalindua sp.]
MIIDRVEYYNCYPYGSAWNSAFEFLDTITPGVEEKKYEIQGDDIYAIVASYNTKEHYRFEAHREYVDIQCLLDGQEILESTALNGLTVDAPYDPKNDVAFYVKTDNQTTISHLIPGIFIAFFPHDAHMPGVSVRGSSTFVKKVVVKIRAELLRL